MIKGRHSGILLHITSLPSEYGIGDFGPVAYQFADLLQESGQHFWQLLPINPTDVDKGSSPYSSISAFAGNTLFISPDILVKESLLEKKDIKDHPEANKGKVDYRAVTAFKEAIHQKAFEKFNAAAKGKMHKDFNQFVKKNNWWLDDHTLYKVLGIKFRSDWGKWPEEYHFREKKALDEARKELKEPIQKEQFLQFLFLRQWNELRKHCHKKGIHFIGDLSFYVSYDSADVWSYPQYFKLDKKRKPFVVAGVPPDYFSKTGQLWGNPVYDWKKLKEQRYDWWVRRIEHNLAQFQWVRLDHFKAFSEYWEVPASEKTAINGKWRKGPGSDFFKVLQKKHKELPLVAEDLGEVNEKDFALRDEFDLPGMRVLQFAFSDTFSENRFLPHRYVQNTVAYTGTHDNTTIRGWLKELSAGAKKHLSLYIIPPLEGGGGGFSVTDKNIHKIMINLASSSVAGMAIFPMQDILGLGEKATMNTPSTSEGNWQWQLKKEQLNRKNFQFLKEKTKIYERG